MRAPPEQPLCPVCHSVLAPDAGFCEACGVRLAESPAQEILSVNYLLAELSRWEEAGLVAPGQASGLRSSYERRREELRAQLAANGGQAKHAAPEASTTAQQPRREHRQPAAQKPPRAKEPRAKETPRATKPTRSRRPLLETLADPQTLRLLLYTGAAMLVVGVVIWLRDILYLKLQEPVVQATLLAIGTLGVTAAGWLTVLRTRLRLMGRTLTLTGSLLFPVNFWFLVRSGLVSDNGRAWLVCALCALLYAHTAAVLREKLYVYLAGVATIFTGWAIIYRVEREAFGLYALTLMTLCVLFLHLSRLFPAGNDESRLTMNDGRQATDNPPSAIRHPPSRLGHELWGPPLVHVALVGAAVGLLFYMPLRLGSPPSHASEILRLRAGEYDSGTAMLLFWMGAYIAWFAGRYVFTQRRVQLYAASALLLFWTEFLAADSLRLSAQAQLLLLAGSAAAFALLARRVVGAALAPALHRAGLLAAVLLAVVVYPVVADAPAFTLTHSAVLACLAVTFGVSSAPRFCDGVTASVLAHAAAVFASAAFLVALLSREPESHTVFYAACAAWTFALYGVATWAGRETQLVRPFKRIADAEFVLLLLIAAVVAFGLSQSPGDRMLDADNLRAAMFCVTTGAVVYGALRAVRDSSFFGASVIPVALLIAVLIILRVDAQWFATALVLTLFPVFFVGGRYARVRGAEWLAQSSAVAAGVILAIASAASVVQALGHARLGDPGLLAPCVALGAVALLSLAASVTSVEQMRVRYFRAGLLAFVAAFALACLRAGFDPASDPEIYTSPVAGLLLVVAYLSARGGWAEYEPETSLPLWAGSVLLAGPLLLHALEYRLVLDVPAPTRDLVVLCAALALVLFGVVGRLRAPVLVGAVALTIELAALALTTVRWLQLSLKAYLISVGVLIVLVCGLLEFRREQILRMRQLLSERREMARERFGEWR